MLLRRSMGITRSAPNKGFASPSDAGNVAAEPPAAAGAVLAVAPVLGAAPAPAAGAPPPLMRLRAASTSLMDAYLRGNTPTDMPLSKSTSNVATRSSQPSACVRVPASTSKLRRLSTRTSESACIMGRKMVAISAAPMNCRGTTIAPYPGGSASLPTCRVAEPMPLSASGLPT